MSLLKKLPSDLDLGDDCTARTSVATVSTVDSSVVRDRTSWISTGNISSVTDDDADPLNNNNSSSNRSGSFPYEPSKCPLWQEALEDLRERLSDRISTTITSAGDDAGTLHFDSMKECFDLDILTQFYEELMIPNFPLDEERDDLDDWLYYLDPSLGSVFDPSGYPSMDVLILYHRTATTTTIIGGVAFEYYPQSKAGLLSYMVVSDQFRRLGILATLHPVFSEALQALHQNSLQTSSKIGAIFAETNTTTAGDVPPEEIRKRHEILYRLGYRLLQFPYVQPPLATDTDSFDEIMLLVYLGSVTDMNGSVRLSEEEEEVGTLVGEKNNNKHDRKSLSITTNCGSISTQFLFQFVLEFYHSVFGPESLEFQDHWYYRLVSWYAPRNPITKIQMDLPWDDVTPKLSQEMEQHQLQHQENEENTSNNSNNSYSIKCGQ